MPNTPGDAVALFVALAVSIAAWSDAYERGRREALAEIKEQLREAIAADGLVEPAYIDRLTACMMEASE